MLVLMILVVLLLVIILGFVVDAVTYLRRCAALLQMIFEKNLKPAAGDKAEETGMVHRDRVSVFKERLAKWLDGQ